MKRKYEHKPLVKRRKIISSKDIIKSQRASAAFALEKKGMHFEAAMNYLEARIPKKVETMIDSLSKESLPKAASLALKLFQECRKKKAQELSTRGGKRPVKEAVESFTFYNRMEDSIRVRVADLATDLESAGKKKEAQLLYQALGAEKLAREVRDERLKE